MLRSTIALLVIAALAAPALGTPYWVAWEGEDYPENEGWTRVIDGDGPANRTLESGILTIDSLWSTQVDDYYYMERELNPDPGETFVIQWRLRIAEVIGNTTYDPGIGLFSDDEWGVAFHFGKDGFWGVFEDFHIPFEPSVFHSFELRSTNMRTYELIMDGSIARIGNFWEPAVTGSYTSWGDGTLGSASRSDWDYLRFGVVPEPALAGFSLVVLGLLLIQRRQQ